MIKYIFPILFILISSQAFSQNSRLRTIEIGEQAPLSDYRMEDLKDNYWSLEDLLNNNGLLVIFTCNTCPFVINWEDRYPAIVDFASARNITTVLVNSNEAKRAGEDSPEEMRKHAAEKNYNAPYLIDKDHKLADAFGARTTPHVFLFDKNLKLVYKGAIDDNNEDAGAVKEKWLEKALHNLEKGLPIDPSETKNLGCSIKRNS